MSETQTRSVVQERTLPQPPQTVWRALTEPALIERWLMTSDFAPKVGHAFEFRADPAPGWSGITPCEVLEVDPPRRLVYSWGDGSAQSNGVATVVTWTLTPDGEGTRLRMEQSGFDAGAGAERFYRGAEWGWNSFLGKLEGVAGEL